MKSKFFLLLCLLCLDLAMLHDLFKLQADLTLNVLDVGQGDALLLTTPEHHNILIDGGPGNAVLMELSDVMPESFREIDLMILTHPHLDHVEGLITVLKRFDVHAVLMSAPNYESLVYDAFLEAVHEEGAAIYFADDDVDFRLGTVTLDTIYPFDSQMGKSMDNINNASPVILVNDCMLLTGDAELAVEEALLNAGLDVDVDILKAGHHGSKTSSSWDFLQAVQAETMIISAGESNSFGHPHDETLKNASDLGMEVLRTDLDGRISVSCQD